ncbi:TolC family protein [Aliikangiella marina]|uniref:TolC family protein n=1 Tax=Aliikangiella marina TaxID=1712262 RepID=A0A545T9Q5_9GAMM|nr:TolC family protein [Aliikangiella marina]TQV73937.1 TolC family protein [Aliikangiella marina]
MNFISLMKLLSRRSLLFVVALLAFYLKNLTASELSMTLTEAIALAQQNDPWLEGSKHRQLALEAQSVAAGVLPDPKVSLSLANLPVDGFDFNQEPMTQVKFGVSQMFPRGETLEIEAQRLRQLSEQFPYLRIARKAQVTERVTHLWLDAHKAKESILLIESNRSLFEQLIDIVQANYASTIGRTRQQDLVRAQLELSRLDDKLIQLEEQFQIAQSQITEWLFSNLPNEPSRQLVFGKNPQIALHPQFKFLRQAKDAELVEYMTLSPQVVAVEKKITASKTNELLAKQSYKPAWGLNASYGFRDDDPNGNSRADFFSLGVSFDIPINTSSRQDNQVVVASSHTAKLKTEKWQLLRQWLAKFKSLNAKLQQLTERKKLFDDTLLPQMYQQAEAYLTAYTNDEGDFAEVVRARIAQLNSQIESLAIEVERQKTIASINYYLTQTTQVSGESK